MPVHIVHVEICELEYAELAASTSLEQSIDSAAWKDPDRQLTNASASLLLSSLGHPLAYDLGQETKEEHLGSI